jgi:hypothetical protein
MVSCPSCGRPAAVARAICLYCGAPAPPGRDAEVVPPTVAAETPAGGDRWLLVLDLAGASEAALAHALGRPPCDVRLLVRRGGLHLHRVLDAGEAEAEARHLVACGLAALLVPEAEVRVRPLRALAGERGEATLALRTEEGPVIVRRGDLLLVVAGPITREYQTSSKRRRVDTARPDEGYRVHLHRRGEPRPVEIDAATVELGFAITGSARLELDAWVAEVAGGAPRDDGFRRLPPALAPAEPEPKGALSAARSLGLAARAAAGGRHDRVVVLDNVEQFRFYSGWRAAVERRRRGAD